MCIGVEEKNLYMGEFFSKKSITSGTTWRIWRDMSPNGRQPIPPFCVHHNSNNNSKLKQQLQDLDIKRVRNRVKGKLVAMERDIQQMGSYKRRASADYRIRNVLSRTRAEACFPHINIEEPYELLP
jgi:hypothetical protein